MTNYTVTNTFYNGEISVKRYELIWRDLIERAEKSSTKTMDNGTQAVL